MSKNVHDLSDIENRTGGSDDLIDAGYEEAAEEVPREPSLREQQRLALKYRDEFGLRNEPEGDGVTVDF